MTKDKVLTELQHIFREHFKNEQLDLSPSSSQVDVPNWDSLNHAVLIDKIETYYAIKFDLMDMISMENVGDICDKIIAKKNQ